METHPSIVETQVGLVVLKTQDKKNIGMMLWTGFEAPDSCSQLIQKRPPTYRGTNILAHQEIAGISVLGRTQEHGQRH
jgi:hypothetical protein